MYYVMGNGVDVYKICDDLHDAELEAYQLAKLYPHITFTVTQAEEE